MKSESTFFKTFFLGVGVLWTICGLSIILFQLSFEAKEIVLTLALPLAYAIIRQFDKKGKAQEEDKQEAKDEA